MLTESRIGRSKGTIGAALLVLALVTHCAGGESYTWDGAGGDEGGPGDGSGEVGDDGDAGADADTELGEAADDGRDEAGEAGPCTGEWECDDGVDCTVDTCNLETGRCSHEPDGEFCSDGDPCTGEEHCDIVLGCVGGTPPTCDDTNDCTVDTCDSLTGECAFAPGDDDRDTYPDAACGGTDCNDDVAGISPAASEICNAVDDDCDGLTDETFDCLRGTVGACVTSCGSSGTRTCSSFCTWDACAPPPETCNGVDDDCVSGCDNGWACCAGATETASCGFCGTQTRTCGSTCTWGPLGSCTGAGVCGAGSVETRACACGGTESRVCSGSCTWGAWTGCSGGACVPGTTQSCYTSCGSTGSQVCSGSCTWGTCSPPPETCNGRDDDCVSGCDNGWACCAGTTVTCNNPCGVSGTRTCSGGCVYGSCCAASEVCSNGCDDDCDGSVDEGCSTTATVYFPSSSDSRYTGSGGTYFWNSGDYVTGSRTVALSTTWQAAIHVGIAYNSLSCDNADMRMLINGIEVGRFSVTPGITTLDRTFSFAAIAGPTYTLRYEVVRTVGSGCGSFYFDYATSTVTLTGSP